MRLRTVAWLVSLLALAACAQAGARQRAHGLRLATEMGCISCHGEKLDGHVFEENAQFAFAWSSNLSRILPGLSNAQIDQTLRTGKRMDGTPLWFMPTFVHRRLSHEDMQDLIAWLRTVPPTGQLHPPIKFGPLFKAALAQGFQNSADEAARLAARNPADLGQQYAKGRYLASITCAECHGPDLKGPRNPQPGDAPDLMVAATYSPAGFERLVRTGIKQDGSKAVLMGEEAPKRLSIMTSAEIESIRLYLGKRPAR
ncbi:c-type cytochrome [Sphingomonas immobilis]|uniref:C-type cytochrome n=1 Tax=Sphingomonas immobilis TaxID=3063997 RepID=A0ABT8ZX59_9SPHN|nr:c-type cytochrome [Sphingomonas sp. CA1-15]MDO7841878.1 c-type cytochrome [Sphingomonas sp. CA1-15]